MKGIKSLLIVMNVILLTGFLSAYYPGETITVNNTLGTTDLDYLIADNSTEIEGLEFNVTNEEIKITLPQNLPPNNFMILFIHQEESQQVIIQGGSSGGGCSSCNHQTTKVNNTNYSPCINGTKMCSGDSIYLCNGINGWVIQETCEYGCNNDICNDMKNDTIDDIPKEENNKPSKGLVIAVLSILAIFLIIYIYLTVKKNKKENKKED
jgi:hypothetical protein